uniref:hypothetical protein n=1 Tax=Methylobacterium sp. B34 TaxID=95563 RepID=UPI0005B26110|nr:hypothetical protein [Methylobacterium sp. B34]
MIPDFIDVPEWGMAVTKYILITEDDDFSAHIQYVKHPTGEIQCMAHLDVRDFTISSYRNMLVAWEQYRPELPEIIFIHFTSPTPATDKFARRLGFIPLLDMPCTDGITRTLWSHRR